MRLIRDPNAVIEGEVLYKGRDLLALPQREMRDVRGPEIAMIFQDPMTSLNPVYTVGWQIAEQMRAHEQIVKRARHGRGRSSCSTRSASRARAARRRLSASVLGRHAPARDDRDGALLQPDLLIADEPTTALDVTIQAQILELLTQAARAISARRSC